MFADELREITSESNRKFAEAQRQAALKAIEDRLFEAKLQRQKIQDLVEATRQACIETAENGNTRFIFDLTPFRSRMLGPGDDPVCQAIVEWCALNGVKCSSWQPDNFVSSFPMPVYFALEW